MDSYRQGSKNAVRKRMLQRAVSCLTTDRSHATVIQSDELSETVEWFANQLPRIRELHDGENLRHATFCELEEWLAFQVVTVGTRTAAELKVLYLCGPEPLNDLSVLTELGISQHNVWAVTSSKEDHAAAVQEASDAGVSLKIHLGNLAEFFGQFNEVFDIIYFDACGPVCGGKPNTLGPLVNIFQHERLRSPGVLVTTFSQQPSDAGASRSRYVDLITSYFAPQYRGLPRFAHKNGPDPMISQLEPEVLGKFVDVNLTEMYSEFLTRFIIDLGMTLIPSCRALSMGSLARNYLPKSKAIDGVRETANDEADKDDGLPGPLRLSPGSYPLVSFLRNFSTSHPDDPVLNLLAKPKDGQRRSMAENLEIASLLSGVVEGHWKLLNAPMHKAIHTSWFDYRLRVTCDVPLPNLTINSLLGIYGRPWFPNPRQCERVSYTAKTQHMYCDLFLLDQCRSYFDWFPVLEAVPSRFNSIPFQIVARCIMDRIGRHHFTMDNHPFRGGAVVGHHELSCARFYDLADRERVQ